MDPAIKLQQQMALSRYTGLSANERHRVHMLLNQRAQEKGYFNEQELKNKKPYIWDQLCAEIITALFR